MKITLAMTVVGLVIGFLAGYWVAPKGDKAGELAGLPPIRMPETIGFRDDSPYRLEYPEAGSGGPIEVVKKVRMPVKGDFEDVAACNQEVKRLNAAVEHLTVENFAHKKEMEYEVGSPIPFPPDLDPKYLEPALMKNVNEAFKEVGLDGDVSFVDCDEFPCIVCSGLEPKQGEEMNMKEMQEMFGKMKKSEAMSDYKDSQQHNSVVSTMQKSDGGTTETLNNCQAIFPKQEDEQMREAIQKRLHWRMMNLAKTM